VTPAFFGTLADGDRVDRLTLLSGDLTVSLLTYGAILNDVRLAGVDHSLTLGSDDLAAYEGPLKYHGAIVGPVANRIAQARASLDGHRYVFDANEGGTTTLHGGYVGTHARVWQVTGLGADWAGLRLMLADGEGGFPGNRVITVRYAVLPGNVLELVLEAVTDAPTWINLAHHGYWNLSGAATTEGHRLMIHADRYTPVDGQMIPTGVAAVEGTAFDFRTARPIGAGQPDRYDHNFCLSDQREELREVTVLTGPGGFSMRLSTTEPGLQVYDAARNSSAPFRGFGGEVYGPFSGIAIEAQGWPDALNQPGFPSIVLRPDAVYRQVTRWGFQLGKPSQKGP